MSNFVGKYIPAMSGLLCPARGQPGRGRRGQALVEFAFVIPPLLLILAGSVDLGRLIYTYSAISSAAREGARTVAMQPNEFSDCLAISRTKAVGQGFDLRVDPGSLVGNTDPNSPGAPSQPTSPPPNQGYVYIWPAVARSIPQDVGSNCNGPSRQGGTVKHVAVEVQFNFIPLTPVMGSITSGFIIKTISVVQAEY